MCPKKPKECQCSLICMVLHRLKYVLKRTRGLPQTNITGSLFEEFMRNVKIVGITMSPGSVLIVTGCRFKLS